MPTPPRDDQDSMQFRGPTLEDAIALAEQSLGARVRVVAANRIRRGGIGGFFASDLGVEVTVALDDETIEQALERLVAETAADERDLWMATHSAPAARTEEQRSQQVGTSSTAASAAAVTTLESLMPSAPPRNEPTTMVRVEQIIEELQHLTAAPLFGGNHTRYGGRRPMEPMPAEPPAAPAVEAVVDALADAIGVQRPVDRPTSGTSTGTPSETATGDPSTTPALRFEPSMSGPIDDLAVDAFVARARPGAATHATEQVAAIPTAAAAAEVATNGRTAIEAPEPEPAMDAPVAEPRAVHAAADIELTPTARPASSSAPSRRQVELAVAATDQLMESLKREEGVKRVSVRVVLRTGDQREVEAEAEWEAS